MDILKTDIKNPDRQIINQAVKVLISGGLIVYPTDTAYGLGGNALNENSIRKIYELKNRNFSKPTHVIIKDWKMLEKLTYPNTSAKILYNNFLPGPLTIILKRKNIIPDILTSGLNTLGVRIPKCGVTKLLSELSGIPYTTPSANRTGGKTPYSINEVFKELDTKKIDLIIDCGILPESKPSTLVDLTQKPFRILREGPVIKSQIEKVLEEKF
jgi:L-threonylcarbamoyladenylate synthase